jgi:hypothetical protein
MQASFGGALGVSLFELIEMDEGLLRIPYNRGVEAKKIGVCHWISSLSQNVYFAFFDSDYYVLSRVFDFVCH